MIASNEAKNRYYKINLSTIEIRQVLMVVRPFPLEQTKNPFAVKIFLTLLRVIMLDEFLIIFCRSFFTSTHMLPLLQSQFDRFHFDSKDSRTYAMCNLNETKKKTFSIFEL